MWLQILTWLQTHGLRILLVIVAAWLAHRFIHALLERLVRRLLVTDRFPSKEAERKTEDTIIKVFHGALLVLIWAVAAMMVLAEFGLDIGPLLAGAGVAGLALGFGAQYLIRDMIAGLFIIIENQYRIGDVVCINDKCGLVEDIDLRLTVLRDLDGTVHNIPNGEIKISSNKSKKFARVKLELGVSYKTDIDKLTDVVNAVGQELAADAAWQEHITKPPSFERITNFADSAVTVLILAETKPLKQWAVAGELRKRLKVAFEREGIEIPFPQVVVHKPANGLG